MRTSSSSLRGLLQGWGAAFISQVLACSPQPPCTLPVKALQTHLPALGPALVHSSCPRALSSPYLS